MLLCIGSGGSGGSGVMTCMFYEQGLSQNPAHQMKMGDSKSRECGCKRSMTITSEKVTRDKMNEVGVTCRY